MPRNRAAENAHAKWMRTCASWRVALGTVDGTSSFFGSSKEASMALSRMARAANAGKHDGRQSVVFCRRKRDSYEGFTFERLSSRLARHLG